MAPRISNKKALMVHSEATYQTPAAPTGGPPSTNFLPVKTTHDGLGSITFNTTFDEGTYATGRSVPTQMKLLQQMGSFSLTCQLLPYAAAIGDAASPPTKDGLDLIMDSAFGTAYSEDGIDVDTIANGTFELGTDDYQAGQLVAVWEAGINDANPNGLALSQVRMVNDVTVAGPPTTYGIHRDWDENPTTAGIAYGYRGWGPDTAGAMDSNNNTLTFLYLDDDTVYALRGCKAVPQSISYAAGQIATITFDIQASDVRLASAVTTPNSLAGLDTAAEIDQNFTDGAIIAASQTPICGQLGEVEFNGSVYSGISNVDISFNTQSAALGALDAVNGVGAQRNLTHSPMITVTALADDTFRTLMTGETVNEMVVRLGSGQIATVSNMWAYGSMRSQVVSVGNEDDGGQRRHSVAFKSVDSGSITESGDSSVVDAGDLRHWTLCRF